MPATDGRAGREGGREGGEGGREGCCLFSRIELIPFLCTSHPLLPSFPPFLPPSLPPSLQHSLEQRKSLLAGPMEFFDELERLGPLLGVGGNAAAAAAAGAGGGGGGGGGVGMGGRSMPLLGGGVVVTGGGGGGGLLFTSRAAPGSQEFSEVLSRIDHAIAFFESHPQVGR